MESGFTGSRAALLAAVRRHPERELAVRRLIAADERFRDICEELADAELALANTDGAPAATRAARRAEWQELVDRLAGELKSALEGHEVALRSRVARAGAIVASA